MPPRPSRPGPRKTGPDLSWEDDDDQPSSTHQHNHPSNIPEPTFPPRYIRTPAPLSAPEHRQVTSQLLFRARARSSPLFCTLDPSHTHTKSKLQTQTRTPATPRAAFDPFASQDRYSTRHLIRSRREPDFSAVGAGDYGFTLQLFPQELWGVMDPMRRLPAWQSVGEDSVAYASLGRKSTRGRVKVGEEGRKRRRLDVLEMERLVDDDDDDEEEQEDGDEEDAIPGAAARLRRRELARARRDDEAARAHKQKSGLDAEDEYDQADPDAAGLASNTAGAGTRRDADEDGEEEIEDEEFEDSDDGGGDYDAEQYFDGGDDEGDGFGDDGGGDGGDY